MALAETPVHEPVVIRTGATPLPQRAPVRGWRAKLRAHPVGRFWLRLFVGLLGTAMIIAAPLLGWLPGPGGIPLFLLGMAVLGTEFGWAARLRRHCVHGVHLYLTWPKRKRYLFWVCFFAVIWIFWYVSLVITGVPSWVPRQVADLLRMLPGVDTSRPS
ncbi:hypothetical protein HMPREF1531_02124 [Propionibacterium sp. oral taxon 192 str. F0372]|uniref:PGPGW domain-containing protein n=1 Tax=Propionibacterium sp. oral taxon 192 TaxID=671222 RepID=UPI0003545445|nr:PGPGW domain-containing protein [Propionibacterium sp. oral taxon 192]EPH02812.1 hypothetical protein HMPREF1531_02124 [Propionibacterium sp. oral taxon 192 str. F0372]